MAPADPDAVFGDGAELGLGIVAKAQLRFRVRPPRHLAAQDVLDRVVAAYDERMSMIADEVADVIRHASARPVAAERLVLAIDEPGQEVAVAKAVRAPFRPGSRGGKWYRDSKGNVRYGDPPEGRFMGYGADNMDAPHVDHLRPRSFMGMFGNDADLTGFLVNRGAGHGFSDGELRFLSAWYGTGEEGGSLLDAFLECAGLTRDDLKSGVANFRFGSQQLTYEEAVFEFIAAQGELFMGEEPTSDDQVEEWHEVLNDEIKPLIDGAFLKYEEAKDDEELQQAFADEPALQRRRFFDAARRCRAETASVADSVLGGWDPARRVEVVVGGLRAMGMFARPAAVDRHTYIHGRPHLRDAVVMDGRLLAEGPRSPLLGAEAKLTSLPASQLMLLYVAAELHRRWDPLSRSFSTEKQEEIGSGDLGEAALAALASKTARWEEAADIVVGHLEDAVDDVVAELNRVNSREGMPDRHAPAGRPSR